MGIEFELKFRAKADVLARLEAEIPGRGQVFHMETTYYDTPTGSFSARYCTLRRRMENSVSICTLKTPAGPVGRNEWEVSCPSIEAALEELCKLGAPQDVLSLAKEGLNPICGARFRRTAKTIQLGDCCLELALDQGVLTGGGREIPLCEVEVELKSGSEAVCTAYANALAAKYGLVPEKYSKFRRAQALYKGESHGKL